MIPAFIGLEEVIPLLVFAGFVLGSSAVLSMISRRNSQAQERLDRISPSSPLLRKKGPAVVKKGRIQEIVEAAKALAESQVHEDELAQDPLKVQLANAGFRGRSAVNVYRGLQLASLALFLLAGLAVFLPTYGFTFAALKWVIALAGLGFYVPTVILRYLRSRRQQAISRTLPDVLDLLVVCMESGLGLDAALRKVCAEMKHHAKVTCEELSLANLQLQMGRLRREVLHDLGVRTGVNDMRTLAALLIQADRLGAPIAQALRVQSDAMRTERRQWAEEKAARTAVMMIFPLVLFIFPGMFVVLAGPAVISKGLWPFGGW